MDSSRGRPTPPPEAGFALIEVVISAFLIVLVGGAVLALISATTRSAAQDQARTQAYSLAQEDLSRMRSMRISSLNGLHETRTLTLNGREFEVESTGVFVNNTSGSTSCSENESSPDYVRINSTVRQKSGLGSPISLRSLVSPSNGSLDPTHGSIVIDANNAKGEGVTGLTVNGTGAGSFSGTTESAGCAIFADLPAGSYTLKASGSGLVNGTGSTTTEQTVQVTGNQTQRIPLLFDRPGTLKAPFYYKVGSTETQVVPTSVAVYNAELGSTAEDFTPTTETIGGTKYAVVSPLFPYITSYTIYPGACEGDKPSSTEAFGSIVVPPGGEGTTGKIRMPTFEVTVTTNGSTKIQGARVTLTDDNCSGTKYVYTTESNGHQSTTTTGAVTPAIPWGKYDICASANFSSSNHRLYATNVPIETVTSTVTKSLNLTGSGSESGSTKTCP